MIRCLYGLLIVLAVLGAAALGGYAWINQEIVKQGPLSEEATVLVAKGDGVRVIADKIEKAGLTSDARLFLVAARLTGDAPLKAGEFTFPAHASLSDILQILRFGRPVAYKFTVIEGQTVYQVLENLITEDKLTGDIQRRPAEGSLLPQTYLFNRGDDRQELLDRMSVAMNQTLTRLWNEREPNPLLPSVKNAVILASIVEKETGVPSERARIAGVFLNRLRLGMKLQSDPTTIYAASQGKGFLDRQLSRADLAIEHPINTYHAASLPPQPICNPGEDSLIAVLHPEDVKYLYFVADGEGGHRFAKTLDEHNRNVMLLRRQSGK